MNLATALEQQTRRTEKNYNWLVSEFNQDRVFLASELMSYRKVLLKENFMKRLWNRIRGVRHERDNAEETGNRLYQGLEPDTKHRQEG